MLRRAVFLDRDGVLNRTFVVNGVPHPPSSLGELEILPGVVEATKLLREAGFALIVVTNQPDISRGTQTRAVVDQINAALHDALHFDAVYMCTHDNADNCNCRKPRPGMLLTAAKDHNLDLANSVMIGDRAGDVEAGFRAGCRTVFVAAGYGRPPDPPAQHTVSSLREAVSWIIEGGNSGVGGQNRENAKC